jgi:hypothetical protein
VGAGVVIVFMKVLVEVVSSSVEVNVVSSGLEEGDKGVVPTGHLNGPS